MKIASLSTERGPFLGAWRADGVVDLNAALPGLPRDLGALLEAGPLDVPALAAAVQGAGAVVPSGKYRFRSLIPRPGKVLCLGLNYVDHANESRHDAPTYPVVFGRFATSFVGHEEALIRPRVSDRFDYESELVVVIGKTGRHIDPARALEHVAGYSLMNDGSIRDYQVRTPQWTIGKNFDASGSIGPWLVTADALPPGARGLQLQGRLNGRVLQEASTDDMIFDVVRTLSILSEAMTLEAGDVIAMGTPGGVGFVRQPPVFMQPGDVFEVEVQDVGILRNPIAAEP